MTEVANVPKRRHTVEDKTQALIAYLATGSLKEASRISGIATSTIQNWRDTSEVELYARLSHDYADRIDQAIEAQYRDTIVQLGQVERDLTERLLANTSRVDPRDLPAAIKNITAAKTQSTEQLMKLTGRATDIQINVDARDLIAEITRLAQPYVTSTATEATEATEAP